MSCPPEHAGGMGRCANTPTISRTGVISRGLQRGKRAKKALRNPQENNVGMRKACQDKLLTDRNKHYQRGMAGGVWLGGYSHVAPWTPNFEVEEEEHVYNAALGFQWMQWMEGRPCSAEARRVGPGPGARPPSQKGDLMLFQLLRGLWCRGGQKWHGCPFSDPRDLAPNPISCSFLSKATKPRMPPSDLLESSVGLGLTGPHPGTGKERLKMCCRKEAPRRGRDGKRPQPALLRVPEMVRKSDPSL